MNFLNVARIVFLKMFAIFRLPLGLLGVARVILEFRGGGVFEGARSVQREVQVALMLSWSCRRGESGMCGPSRPYVKGSSGV